MSGFVKAMRTEEADFLDKYPIANHVMNVIARRARRTKCLMSGLEIGECFIGHKGLGITEAQYRTAKKQLKDWGLVEFKRGRRATDVGTVAKLLNSKVYDINLDDNNGSSTEEQRKNNGRTTEEQRKDDGRATTNKECKKERKKEDNSSKPCKDKKDRLNYEELRNIYNENLTNAPEVQVITDSRKKKLKQFFEQFDLTPERFKNYLTFINNHTEMKWAFERRPKNDGSGQFWNAKGFDYFISEKCFLKAKEDLQNDIR